MAPLQELDSGGGGGSFSLDGWVSEALLLGGGGGGAKPFLGERVGWRGLSGGGGAFFLGAAGEPPLLSFLPNFVRSKFIIIGVNHKILPEIKLPCQSSRFLLLSSSDSLHRNGETYVITPPFSQGMAQM